MKHFSKINGKIFCARRILYHWNEVFCKTNGKIYCVRWIPYHYNEVFCKTNGKILEIDEFFTVK